MKHRREIIYIIGFLFALPVALTSYVNSSLLNTYMSKYAVSVIYIVASIFTIWSLIVMPKILKKLGNSKTTVLFCTLLLLSFALMAFGNGRFAVETAFILNFLAINVVGAALDIFVEDFSQGSHHIGRFRGFYLSVINAAWVLAQLISGSVISATSFKGVYLLSTLFMVVVTLSFAVSMRSFKDPEYKKVRVLKTLKVFVDNKHISKIYFLNFILQFFYAWMVIYMPIYLNQVLGFGWDQIGVIFTIMLLPFVLLSFPLGKLSDKIGEKKMLAYAFLIIAVSTLSIPLVPGKGLWFWAAILFGTRVGAASISVLSDTYFFKIVSEDHADIITFYRNTAPLSYIIAPLLAIPLLRYTPSIQYLFYILACVLLAGLFTSLRLRDVK